MAEYFLEPQNPLKKIDDKTGDIYYIYPETTDKQVKMSNGERLSTILNESILYMDDTDSEAEIAPMNADTFGGNLPEYYATAEELSWVQTEVSEAVCRFGDEMDGQLTLFGDPTENMHAVTKRYVDNKTGVDILWENPDPTASFAAQDITIENPDKYSYFIVNWIYSTTGTKAYTMNTIVFNGDEIIFIYVTDDMATKHHRAVKLNDGVFSFASGYAKTTVTNTSGVPCIIYGVK